MIQVGEIVVRQGTSDFLRGEGMFLLQAPLIGYEPKGLMYFANGSPDNHCDVLKGSAEFKHLIDDRSWENEVAGEHLHGDV